MSPIDEGASFERKTTAAQGRKPKAAASGATEQPAPPDLVALTVDATTGRIVSVERVDAAGARHALSAEDESRLVGRQAKATLEQIVEQAFEAGIDCVLNEFAADPEQSESAGDAELSRMLLRSLMESSGVRRLVRRDVLNQAMIGTLIEQAAAFRAAKSESAAAH
jgi:hypothetical protein